MINIFICSSFTGLHTVLLLLWVLFHGLAAVKLIQHLLYTFPSCASIGVYHATIVLYHFCLLNAKFLHTSKNDKGNLELMKMIAFIFSSVAYI